MRLSHYAPALALLACTSAVHADVLSGLIARYSFEGNFNDTSGSGLHGVAQGGVSFGTGRLGQGAVFDGVNDVVLVPHGGALTFDLDIQSYTISAWFFMMNLPTNSDPCILQDRYGSNHSVSYGITFNGDTVPQWLTAGSWYGVGTGSYTDIRVLAAPLLGAWHHVALAFDANATNEHQKMYIDGHLVGFASRPNEPFTPGPGNTLTIGSYWSSNSMLENWFSGKIDEVRIYNRALSPSEIAVLANPEGPTYCPTGLVESFESNSVGAAPANWDVRFSGGGSSVVASQVSEGGKALRMVGQPFSAIELKSADILPARQGVASVSFRLRWSSESTAAAPDCADALVSYLGDRYSFSMGFARDINGGSSAPLRIAHSAIPITPDRWYSFKGLADFDAGTISWWVDGTLVISCQPMFGPTTDPTRVNRLALHTGCIDDGQAVAYFDEIMFAAQPNCRADYNRSGNTSVQDIFDFLAGYFAGCN